MIKRKDGKIILSQRSKEDSLQEASKAVWEAPEMLEIRESFERKHGFDPMLKENRTGEKAKFPVCEKGFSFSKAMAKLKEADASSSNTQFLRAGLQTIVNSMYESVPSTIGDWVQTVSSDKDTELYAPNHGLAFPSEVGASEKYPEVGAASLDIQLKNRKYGSMYPIEKELLADDQSGTFAKQVGIMGEYMKLLHEVYCYGKLASVNNMEYINLKIRKSETKPSYEANYPYASSAAPFRGGGVNRPTSFGIISKTGIQDAEIGLMNQKNLQGIKMLVNPNRLIVSPKDKFDTSILLNSAYYPSGAAAAGVTGGAFAINPIKGIADLTVTRFMFKNDGTVNGDSRAWYLMDDSKAWFVLQLRLAIMVQQEADNAGASFELDQVRYKASTRFNADHIDPRFVWQGNDGSVTS